MAKMFVKYVIYISVVSFIECCTISDIWRNKLCKKYQKNLCKGICLIEPKGYNRYEII